LSSRKIYGTKGVVVMPTEKEIETAKKLAKALEGVSTANKEEVLKALAFYFQKGFNEGVKAVDKILKEDGILDLQLDLEVLEEDCSDIILKKEGDKLNEKN
jgi:hypothetical protein